MLIAVNLSGQKLYKLGETPASDSLARAGSDTTAIAGDTSGTRPLAGQDSLAAQGDTAGSREKDTVYYEAETLRYREGKFILSEGAELRYQGATLQADSIILDRDSGLVNASGVPLIQDEGNPPIKGYQMKYNLKTKVGEVYYGTSRKDDQLFTGMEVRRQKDGDIHIARGCFTTCEDPSNTYFYSRRMIVQPKSKVLSGPIVMNIEDVPVAVVPMLVMPLKTGRRSGLLQPKFGGDQAQGFFIRGLGYYWAISQLYDAKLSLDIVEGELGTFSQTNLNSEFRYNNGSSWSGNLGGRFFISEFNPANSGWQANFAHDQKLAPDGSQTLKGNGTFVSEREIISQNAISEEERLTQTANANLGYNRRFDWNNATLSASFNQVYNLNTDQMDRDIPNIQASWSSPIFEQPEEIWWQANPETRDLTWYQKLNYSYSGQANANQVRYPEGPGGTGDTTFSAGYRDNISFNGRYSLLQYINVTPSVNFRNAWSLQSFGPEGEPEIAWNPGEGEVGDRFHSWDMRLNADTKLYGIAYPGLGSWEGIRHTITPSMGFTYAPEIDTNRHFVSPAKLAVAPYQIEQQTVSFGLSNDVDIKLRDKDKDTDTAAADDSQNKGVNYKIFSLQSNASYNFAEDIRPWSNINSSFSSEIVKHVPLNLSLTHTLYDDYELRPGPPDQVGLPILLQWSTGWRKGIQLGGDLSTGLRVRSTRGSPLYVMESSPWSASFNYNFNISSTRVSKDAFRTSKVHSASAGLRLHPTSNWEMSYNTDYDFARGEFSRHTFAFNRKLGCWNMEFNWRPIGISEGWDFRIYLVDMPDLKLETAGTRAGGR